MYRTKRWGSGTIKASHIFSLTLECKERRAIAIDETKIKIGDKCGIISGWLLILTHGRYWVYTSAVEGHILMLKSFWNMSWSIVATSHMCTSMPDHGIPRIKSTWTEMGAQNILAREMLLNNGYSILKRRICAFYREWQKIQRSQPSYHGTLLSSLYLTSTFNIENGGDWLDTLNNVYRKC